MKAATEGKDPSWSLRVEELRALVEYSGTSIGSFLSHGHSFHRGLAVRLGTCAACQAVVWDPLRLGRACMCLQCGLWVHRKCISSRALPACQSMAEFSSRFPSIAKARGEGGTAMRGPPVALPLVEGKEVVKSSAPTTLQQQADRISAFYASLPTWTPLVGMGGGSDRKSASKALDLNEVGEIALEGDREHARLTASDLRNVGRFSFAGGVVGGALGGVIGGLVGVKIGALVAASDIAGRSLWKRAQDQRRHCEDLLQGDEERRSMAPRAEDYFHIAIEKLRSRCPLAESEKLLIFNSLSECEHIDEETDRVHFFSCIADAIKSVVLDDSTLPGIFLKTLLPIVLWTGQEDEEFLCTPEGQVESGEKEEEKEEEGEQAHATRAMGGDQKPLGIPGHDDHDIFDDPEDLAYDTASEGLGSSCQELCDENGNAVTGVPAESCGDDDDEEESALLDVYIIRDCQHLLREIGILFMESCPWLKRSNTSMIATATGIDRAVFEFLYPAVFSSIKARLQSVDASFMNRLNGLSELESCPEMRNCNPSAITEFQRLPYAITCYDKLRCLVGAVESIASILEGGKESTADMLLASVCEHLIWARVPNIHAEFYFLEQFCRDDYWLMGREGYALTTVEASVAILSSPNLYGEEVDCK